MNHRISNHSTLPCCCLINSRHHGWHKMWQARTHTHTHVHITITNIWCLRHISISRVDLLPQQEPLPSLKRSSTGDWSLTNDLPASSITKLFDALCFNNCSLFQRWQMETFRKVSVNRSGRHIWQDKHEDHSIEKFQKNCLFKRNYPTTICYF